MRDWILPLAPVIAVVYFVAYPHQFGELVTWAQAFVR
jgi:hypothetical protein